MRYIVEKEWLLQNLNKDDVRIIDCRFSLSEKKNGREQYLLNHIPGALYFDLEEDLSGTVKIHGGRHPLPELTEFAHKLSLSGIDNTKTVIVYDNGEGAFAARFWWMLNYLGHQNVCILNGGYSNWVKAAYPADDLIPSFKEVNFQVNIQKEWLATYEEVKEVVEGKSDVVLIDSREEKRFLGEEEPIDKKAGHIPGAINFPWFGALENGMYRKADDQNNRFAQLPSEKEYIVYCGSGVTAAPNFLSLKEAGYQHVKLYIGSFSDWISYDDNEIGN